MRPTDERLRPARLPALGNWLTLGTAMLAAASVWVLAGVPVEVKRVKVSGIRHLSPAQVEKMAEAKAGTRIGRREARGIRRILEGHPAILKASVSAGVTGTLHVRVKERIPVGWLAKESCAVAEDGVLLRHIVNREPSWVVLAGMRAAPDGSFSSNVVRQAAEGQRLLRESGEDTDGAWCRRAGGAEAWLWFAEGKRVVFSSPVSEGEVDRLRRFRLACPKAWTKARRLDMRFADRVVVKR